MLPPGVVSGRLFHVMPGWASWFRQNIKNACRKKSSPACITKNTDRGIFLFMATPHNSRLAAYAPLRRLRHGICVAKMLDNVGLRYPHRASGAKAPRPLRPLPLLRFAVSATGGAHLCSIQYYLRFWLSICRTSLAVSALRIMRYCPKLTGPDPATEQRSHRQTCRLCRRCSSGSGRFPYHRGYCRYQTGCVP